MQSNFMFLADYIYYLTLLSTIILRILFLSTGFVTAMSLISIKSMMYLRKQIFLFREYFKKYFKTIRWQL